MVVLLTAPVQRPHNIFWIGTSSWHLAPANEQILGGSGGMLPHKIWNLGPLKSLKMLPILSIIAKEAHNFSHFFSRLFLFFAQNTYDMHRQLATKDKVMIVGSTFF